VGASVTELLALRASTIFTSCYSHPDLLLRWAVSIELIVSLVELGKDEKRCEGGGTFESVAISTTYNGEPRKDDVQPVPSSS
jgi:hypothetical protein